MLNLLRQASSDDTGKIAKGTVTGKGMNFKIRSCGMLASCNAQLTEAPDKNRFVVIEMGKPIDKKAYDAWEFRMENIFNAGFQAALPNAKTFAGILAQRLQNNRAGDLYGTLMAGAYLLQSTKVVTAAEAIQFCIKVKFPPETENRDDKSDEDDLWNYMQERKIPFKKLAGDKVVSIDRPLAELIDVAFGNHTPLNYAMRDAEIALADIGMKAVWEEGKPYIAISTNHSGIADLISRSRFNNLEWSPILRRLIGCIPSKKTYRIGVGKSPSKAILIPWGEAQENGEQQQPPPVQDAIEF